MAMPDGISVAYGYDNANRLTSVTYTSGANTVGTLAYGYDAAGHLIAKGGTLATVSFRPVVSATYNADNQLTLWGSQGFTYDFNGNMTSDGTMSYQWNARNQLSSLDGARSRSSRTTLLAAGSPGSLPVPTPSTSTTSAGTSRGIRPGWGAPDRRWLAAVAGPEHVQPR